MNSEAGGKIASYNFWDKLLAEHNGGPKVSIHMRSDEIVKGQLAAIEASQEHIIVEQLMTQVWRYPQVTMRTADIEKLEFEFPASKLVEILQQEKRLLESL